MAKAFADPFMSVEARVIGNPTMRKIHKLRPNSKHIILFLLIYFTITIFIIIITAAAAILHRRRRNSSIIIM